MGKSRAVRSAAAKKAARTRKRNAKIKAEVRRKALHEGEDKISLTFIILMNVFQLVII